MKNNGKDNRSTYDWNEAIEQYNSLIDGKRTPNERRFLSEFRSVVNINNVDECRIFAAIMDLCFVEPSYIPNVPLDEFISNNVDVLTVKEYACIAYNWVEAKKYYDKPWNKFALSTAKDPKCLLYPLFVIDTCVFIDMMRSIYTYIIATKYDSALFVGVLFITHAYFTITIGRAIYYKLKMKL